MPLGQSESSAVSPNQRDRSRLRPDVGEEEVRVPQDHLPPRCRPRRPAAAAFATIERSGGGTLRNTCGSIFIGEHLSIVRESCPAHGG